MPLRWTGPELPDGGWDRAIQRAAITRLTGATPNVVSAIEICIRPDRRAAGLSALMLTAMRQAVAKLRYDTLVAPVHPSGKHTRPDLPIAEYAAQVREDGLPVDPWLRVHVRAGGRVERVATRSMMISGTLAEWRPWTGLPFDTSGPVQPGALVPGALRRGARSRRLRRAQASGSRTSCRPGSRANSYGRMSRAPIRPSRIVNRWRSRTGLPGKVPETRAVTTTLPPASSRTDSSTAL